MEIAKLENFINSTNDLIIEYTNYKNGFAPQSFHPVYSPAIAAVVSWFAAQDYMLSAELLVHAEDESTVYNSTFYPLFGWRVNSSSVTQQIRMNPATSGSDRYPNSGTVENKDLYYAIHRFDWHKTSTSNLIIQDYYDFAPGDYDGIAGIAINTMYMAQLAGVITPYYVIISV